LLRRFWCVVIATALWPAAASVAGAGSDPELLDAVRSGDERAVSVLLRRRADVNVADATGTTALQLAVQADRLDLIRLLIEAGADVKRANRYGVTPLHLAAVNGNAASTQRLIEAGADVNAVLPEGETALMTAARTGAVPVLELLLNRGANVHAQESLYGETALTWAAAENHAGAVRVLVANGAPVNARSKKQEFPRRRAGQSVLSLGGWTPLMYAARQNALDAGRALAGAGAALDEVDPDGATALVIAIINAHYEFAAFLLESGANPNVGDTEAGMGPLYAAIDMHRLAVGHGRPNPRPVGLLDSVDIVRMLLARKADPNAVLKAAILQRHHTAGDSSLGKGATPLMRAAKSGDVEVMKVLLAAGADPAGRMPNQATPLMFAAGLGWRDGSPAAPSYDQGSEEEAVAAIDMLIDRGVPINAATEQGDTALHVAATGRGSPVIVKHLIAKGADLNARNKRGLTPLEAAKASRKDLSALVTILQQADATASPPSAGR
jgi:ankyrin repeat protein